MRRQFLLLSFLQNTVSVPTHY